MIDLKEKLPSELLTILIAKADSLNDEIYFAVQETDYALEDNCVLKSPDVTLETCSHCGHVSKGENDSVYMIESPNYNYFCFRSDQWDIVTFKK